MIRLSILGVLLDALASDGHLIAAGEPLPVGVFDFEPIDASLEAELRGESADEQQRLGAIGERLRRMLEEPGRYPYPVCNQVLRGRHKLDG